MIIAIFAKRICSPTERIENGVVLIEDSLISKVGARSGIEIPPGATIIDRADKILVPGLIDVHMHGAVGHDLMEATPEAIRAVGSHLARHGTTAFLAATVTASLDRTLESVQKLGEIIRGWSAFSRTLPAGQGPVAQPIGIHLEGPFLDVTRRGAHPAAQLQKPSIEALARILEAAEGTVRLLTLAPELEHGLEVVEYARRHGVRVSIGHSNATYEEAEAAIAAGASHTTHLYNAMRPFAHRDPGIIAAVLTDERVNTELICDGIHVQPAAVRLAAKAKGVNRIVLVTDSVSAAGRPDGTYDLGEFKIQVVAGECRTLDGALAGSTLTMDAALRNFARFAALDYEQCLTCATLNPAKILGFEKRKGLIAPGADADFAVVDENYNVIETYIGGQCAPQN